MNSRILFILLFFFASIVAVLNLPSQNHPNNYELDILGGIVPHHLYVSDIIANFFEQLAFASAENVVVLGPNHEELGSHKMVTSSEYFLSFAGSGDLLHFDELNLVAKDQSMTAVLPFVKQKFPESKIIPIVLKYDNSLERCQALSDTIASLPGKTIVIASVDFSHYLSTSQATLYDDITYNLIRTFDYQSLLELDSRYLDSPPSLVTALMYFKAKGSDGLQLLSRANSGERGNPHAPTTSYFSMLYTKAHEDSQ